MFLVGKEGEGGPDGVPIDAEPFGEVGRRRQQAAVAAGAVGNEHANAVGDLSPQGDAGVPLHRFPLGHVTSLSSEPDRTFGIG